MDNDVEDPRKTRTLRRRSTKSFNPAELRRWESVVSRRRGDVFFSLHVPAAEGEPLYVSEVIEKAMNADFQCFDLTGCGLAVGRLDRVVVRVWGGTDAEWRLVVEADVWLGGLVHLGESLEGWRRPLPRNAVVWQLGDGVYTSFWDGEAPKEPALATAGEGTAGERGNPTMVRALSTVEGNVLMVGRLQALTIRS